MSHDCWVCGQKAFSCGDCSDRPQNYLAVKDAWLSSHSSEPAPSSSGAPVQWAIGETPGGIIATWDRARQQFLGTGTPGQPQSHRYGWLELTTACPHRCRHCYLGTRLGHGHAAGAEILLALAHLQDFSVQEVVLAGGEPTMHPGFVTLLDAARAAATHVRVLTNGWTQRPEVIQALAAPGVAVEVPLLGWHKDHDWMTRTPGSFSRVMTSLLRYREAGVAITLTTTLTRAGLQAVPHLRHVAEDWGIPFVPSKLIPEGAAVDHWTELVPMGNEV